MSNVFRFIYDSEFDPNKPTEYPEAVTVKTRHYFSDGTTWPVVLYQFCKFLESTGYCGVTEKVFVKDPFGVHGECGLGVIGPDQYIASSNDPFDTTDKDAY